MLRLSLQESTNALPTIVGVRPEVYAFVGKLNINLSEQRLSSKFWDACKSEWSWYSYQCFAWCDMVSSDAIIVWWLWLWLIIYRGGAVTRETQDPIPQSEYHARLESNMEEVDDSAYRDPNIRYWSDYSCVFLDKKTIQAVPDALEGTEAGWSIAQELFRRYNEVHALFLSLLHLQCSCRKQSSWMEHFVSSLKTVITSR